MQALPRSGSLLACQKKPQSHRKSMRPATGKLPFPISRALSPFVISPPGGLSRGCLLSLALSSVSPQERCGSVLRRINDRAAPSCDWLAEQG